MMSSLAPLRDAPGDRELHVPRLAEAEIFEAVNRGWNVFLLSRPGEGATTSLRFVSARLRGNGWVTVQVSGRSADDSLALLQFLVAETLRTLPELNRVALLGSIATTVPNADPGFQAVSMIRQLRDALESTEPRHVVVVDDASPTLVQSLFGRLRDELWELPFRWIVSGDARLRASYLAQPADAFFDQVVELERLSASQRLDLLRRRVPHVSEQTLRNVADEVESPREALALLDSAEQRGVLPDVLLAERSQRHEKASHIGQAAAALLAEIERQPASAADPDLLARLGLSRQRIYQLLRQLEDANLVTATDENVGRGRPRKVYRVLHE